MGKGNTKKEGLITVWGSSYSFKMYITEEHSIDIVQIFAYRKQFGKQTSAINKRRLYWCKGFKTERGRRSHPVTNHFTITISKSMYAKKSRYREYSFQSSNIPK